MSIKSVKNEKIGYFLQFEVHFESEQMSPKIKRVSLCGFEPQLTNLEFIVYPPKLKSMSKEHF